MGMLLRRRNMKRGWSIKRIIAREKSSFFGRKFSLFNNKISFYLRGLSTSFSIHFVLILYIRLGLSFSLSLSQVIFLLKTPKLVVSLSVSYVHDVFLSIYFVDFYLHCQITTKTYIKIITIIYYSINFPFLLNL